MTTPQPQEQLATYAIRGVLTLRSPAYQTSPDGSGNKSNTFETLVRSDDGTMVRLPYISASSVRGLLRRGAAEYIWAHLRTKYAETEDPRFQILRETFQSVVRGSAGRQDMKPGAATLRDVVAGRQNVFAGLFGGGYYMHPSRLKMEAPLMPLVREAVSVFQPKYQGFCAGSAFFPRASTDKAGEKRDPQTPAQLPQRSIVAIYNLMPRDDFADGKGAGLIEGHEEALSSYQQEMVDTKAAKKEQKAAQLAARAAGGRLDIKPEDRVSLATTKNMLEVQAIVPGVQLYFGLTLRSVTRAQLGLALLALRDWTNENSLGGGSARGFGSFHASLSLEGRGGVILDSSLLQGQAPFYDLANHDLVNSAVDAAHAEIALLDRAALEEIYPLAIADADADDDSKPRAKRKSAKAPASAVAAVEGGGTGVAA